jgi:hypothetical protein
MRRRLILIIAALVTTLTFACTAVLTSGRIPEVIDAAIASPI